MNKYNQHGYNSQVQKVDISTESLQYLLDKCLPDFHPTQNELFKVTQGHVLSIMQTPPEQTTLFQFIFNLLNAKKVIEIGVYTGYNCLGMALSLPEDGIVIGCDISREFTEIGKPYWEEAGVSKKIDLRIQPATKTLQDLIDAGEAGTFDFILIDADKPSYIDYYNLSLELIRKGGVIAIDNVLYLGHIADKNAIVDESISTIRKLNDYIKNDSRVVKCSIPMGDGLTLVTKK